MPSERNKLLDESFELYIFMCVVIKNLGFIEMIVKLDG